MRNLYSFDNEEGRSEQIKRKGYSLKGRKVTVEGHDDTYDSKLEAEWQFLFDETGIRAIPHPGTAKTCRKDGGRIIVYTPDFYLPDYDVYGEVKPTDEALNDYNTQRKISAAMENNCTSVSNGLMILGDISDFSRNDEKKFVLGGEFYKNTPRGIAKCFWYMRQTGNFDQEVTISFSNPKYEDTNNFAHYPRFSKMASACLFRDKDMSLASEIVYRAVFATIYAENNGLIKEVDEKDEQQSRKDESYSDLYDIHDDLSLPFDKD